MAVRRIIEAIVRNEKSILTVSSVLNGEYGLHDVALSIPTIIDNSGIVSTLCVNLDNEEQGKLTNSANTLKMALKDIDI